MERHLNKSNNNQVDRDTPQSYDRDEVSGMLRFHAREFRNYDLEDYDNFDPDAAAAAPRGRSNDRFKTPRSRHKSPCYQQPKPTRRQRWRDIPAGQGRNFSQAPSLPKAPSVTSIESMETSNSSIGGNDMSITTSLSSDSSSSGSRMLSSEPSRSSSRNTMNGLQSPWTSTSSLNHDNDPGSSSRKVSISVSTSRSRAGQF